VKIKMKKLKLLRRIAIATPAVLALSVLVAGSRVENTYALAGSAEQYHKLAVMRGVQQCYSSHAKSQIKQSDFTGWTSIFDGDINSDGEIIIPTKVGNTINDNDFSCQDVFAGYSGVGGSGSGFKNYATIPTTLANFGYVFSHNEGAADSRSGTPNADTDQVTLKFSDITDSSGVDSRPIAVGGEIVINGEQKYHNGWVRKYYHWDITSVSGSLEAKYNGETLYTLQFSGSQYPFQAGTIKHSDGTLEPISTFPYDVDILWTQLYNGNTSDSRLTLADAVSNFTSDVEANVKKAANYVFVSPNVKANVTFTAPKGDDRNNANSVYKIITNGATASEVMLAATNAGEDLPHVDGSISGSSVGGTVKTRGFYWSDAYKYGLYYQYLRDIMSEYSGINIGACSSSKPDGAAYYFKGTKDNWCPINIPADSQGVLSKELAIVGSRDLEMGTFADILEWFKNEDSYKYLEEGDYANVDKKSDDDDDTGGGGGGSDPTGTTNEEICYKGAGSLGWIMCPIIMATSELADWVYDWIEKDFLQVQTTAIFDSSNGVQEVWATFRNLANILFAIFLTVVIFSQLTGFGIDNYGIKKMLPRLIIAAILINFSYIICQIAVDISNIIGASLKNFLETGLNVSSAPGASGVGVGVASGIWVAGVAAFFFANPAAASTLLLLLLSMVIAILFLWLILIARQSGVVICIVISPIALIFYMFPNMDKFFKKWIDIMKGLLLLYPICGLVVGGGKLAGAILSNVGDGNWKVAAMIVQVVPYFIIPSLLRGSINTINGLGDKLGNMGSRGQQKAFNKMYNSETMDRARTAMNASNAFGRRDLADKINKTKFGKVLGRPFYKSITRANQKKRAYQEDDQKASNTMQQVMFESAEQKDQKRIVRDRANGIDTTSAAYQGGLKSTPAAILEQIRQANANNDEERFNSLVTEYQRRTSASKTAEMLAQLVDDEQNNGILGGAKRADFMRRLAQTHASTLAKTPDLKQYLQTGGIDSTGNHISFNDGTSSYMQRNFNGADDGFKIGDLKDNDVVGAGSGAIARMISSGQLTQPQAQRIMASKANREKMDDVQQLLLGAYSRNGTTISKDDAEAALKNHTGVGGFTNEQIQAMLEDGGDDVVIRDVRWRNQDGEHMQSDPLIVKHDDVDTVNSGAATLKKYGDMAQRRVDSGDLTQEQADRLVQQAKDKLRQKNNNP